MNSLAVGNNNSALSYFDPCSKTHQGIENFHRLNIWHQIAVIIVTIATAILSVALAGLGGVAVFRALSQHFRQLEAERDQSQKLLGDDSRGTVYQDPLLSRYGNLTEDEIHRLGELLVCNDLIKNTTMTDILVNYTFAENDLPTDELNAFLGKLVVKAVVDGNRSAQLALTRPNNFNQSAEDPSLQNVIATGFPQNTPLALLVKAGNLEGSQIILPAYTAENLLFADLTGNTALHLATMTGQMKVAHAIMARAEELGLLEDLLAIENRGGKSADEMLSAIFKKENTFKDFLGIANGYFGAEEINKARIGSKTKNVFHCRQRLHQELKALASGPVKLPLTLYQISQI